MNITEDIMNKVEILLRNIILRYIEHIENMGS